jgi:methionine-rich copper-binding protein CopC
VTTIAERRIWVRALAVGAIVVASALGFAAPAQAHNYIVSSTPEEGGVLTELPEQFSITTNGPLLDLSGDASGFAFRVVDAAGLYYGDGCVTVSGSSMYLGAALGEPGDYLVQWQFVSEDGHTLSGEFGFTWAPAGDAVLSEGSSTVPECGVVTEESTAAPEPPSPQDTPDVAVPDDATSIDSDVLWIVGAAGILVIAAVVTVVLVRRRGPGNTSGSER